ncbi:NAD(P)H-dependent amine dehydrogenase family protein [Kordiimonas pumila]|uniref:Dihydrodipicolinate reductase N-terminal domain-containing protein n=1 Tax=Kordiimonas pumila TaxID=2161677 RepID=A0ABV7D7E0_9PROT|nr:hypothetical protein [Kordiimonas pumila]
MTYKVVQWATGAMGKTCLRAVIDHPDLELVGLYVYNPKKVGADAGDIAHRAKTGILATNAIDDILALNADIVIHTPMVQPPYTSHDSDIQRLLASGKNVISINGHSYPQHWGADHFSKFEDACNKGQSTLLGGGLNPGFIVERIAATATGICTRLDNITVREIVKCNEMRSPQYVFDMLGFGSKPGKINPNNVKWPPAELLNGLYSEVVAQLAARLGRVPDVIETEHKMLPASTDIEMAAGIIPKGTISHTAWCWHAMSGGKPFVSLAIDWIMETVHLPEPEFPLWHVSITGDPCVDLKIDLSRRADDPYKTSPEQYGVAGSVMNSIPLLMSAAPGVLAMPSAPIFQCRLAPDDQ